MVESYPPTPEKIPSEAIDDAAKEEAALHAEPFGYPRPLLQVQTGDEDIGTGEEAARRSGEKVAAPVLHPPTRSYLERARLSSNTSSGRRSRRATSLSTDSAGTLLVVGVAKWDDAPRCIRRTATLTLWMLLLLPALATLLGVTSSQVRKACG